MQPTKFQLPYWLWVFYSAFLAVRHAEFISASPVRGGCIIQETLKQVQGDGNCSG